MALYCGLMADELKRGNFGDIRINNAIITLNVAASKIDELIDDLKISEEEIEKILLALEESKCPAYERILKNGEGKYIEIPDSDRIKRLAKDRDRYRQIAFNYSDHKSNCSGGGSEINCNCGLTKLMEEK